MRRLVAGLLLQRALADAAEPHWFKEQFVDHFSGRSSTWSQRFYLDDSHFAGPGHPIFVIMGGEGGIPPETGIFYPWVQHVLAEAHSALVVEPEHRFYGESLPFGNQSFTQEHMLVMTSQQALADAARFIRYQQRARNCTERGTPGYCPVLTIGGSYPGFLSAMMRLRYPAVVDMAYAASAPMRFYSQEVGQYEYYARVTESADRAAAGCPAAVRAAFDQAVDFFAKASLEEVQQKFEVCSPLASKTKEDLADDLLFLAQQTFANLNMANFPPTNATGLARACKSFLEAQRGGGEAPLGALKSLLLEVTQAAQAGLQSGRASIATPGPEPRRVNGCFDLAAHLPAGAQATARCGDWSGCGALRDGEMWDYQTCTFEVEHIGFGGPSQMFPPRPWKMEWLKDHCKRRFNVTPAPTALVDLWGFREADLRAQTSRIVFTNGLNDGWSVGGILHDVAPEKGIVAINMPNGAHHSDLARSLAETTPDVQEALDQLQALIGLWLTEVREDVDRQLVV